MTQSYPIFPNTISLLLRRKGYLTPFPPFPLTPFPPSPFPRHTGQALDFRSLKIPSARQEPASDDEKSVGHDQASQAGHDPTLYAPLPTKSRRVSKGGTGLIVCCPKGRRVTIPPLVKGQEGGVVKKKVSRKRPFEITKTEKVIRLASNMVPTCTECKERFRMDPIDLGEQVNHYLGHGYVLLYIGPDRHDTMNITVAMLGK